MGTVHKAIDKKKMNKFSTTLIIKSIEEIKLETDIFLLIRYNGPLFSTFDNNQIQIYKLHNTDKKYL